MSDIGSSGGAAVPGSGLGRGIPGEGMGYLKDLIKIDFHNRACNQIEHGERLAVGTFHWCHI